MKTFPERINEATLSNIVESTWNKKGIRIPIHIICILSLLLDYYDSVYFSLPFPPHYDVLRPLKAWVRINLSSSLVYIRILLQQRRLINTLGDSLSIRDGINGVTQIILESEAGEKVKNDTNNIGHIRSQKHVTQQVRKRVDTWRTSRTWGTRFLRENDQEDPGQSQLVCHINYTELT